MKRYKKLKKIFRKISCAYFELLLCYDIDTGRERPVNRKQKGVHRDEEDSNDKLHRKRGDFRMKLLLILLAYGGVFRAIYGVVYRAFYGE